MVLSFITANRMTDTRLVALFEIRGYLAFLRPSRSSFTLECLLRGWSVSGLEYFVQNLSWCLVFKGWPFFLRERLIWQRLTNVSCLRTSYEKKGRHSFDPQRVNLLGKESICMVNLLLLPQKIFFFYYLIDLLRLFRKRSFVLSTKFENKNVATIGTLLDQFMLSCK